MLIRPYVPRDRDAVRQICCETADRGEPLERFFHDREAFADLVTRYYTDFEPGSVWVAEHDGTVVGYLTGCLDTGRYRRVLAWRVVPRAVLHAFLRGVFWSRKTWGAIIAGLRTWRHDGLRRRVALRQYPAHLHLNVQQGFRSQQVGHGLMERFLEGARAAGVRGVYAAVSGQNSAACRFFERMGFTTLGRYPVARPDGGTGHLTFTVIYGQRL